MNTALDPIISEFETNEQAASYDRWFCAKVQQAIDSKEARIPHDEAMARVSAILDERRKARASGSVG